MNHILAKAAIAKIRDKIAIETGVPMGSTLTTVGIGYKNDTDRLALYNILSKGGISVIGTEYNDTSDGGVFLVRMEDKEKALELFSGVAKIPYIEREKFIR